MREVESREAVSSGRRVEKEDVNDRWNWVGQHGLKCERKQDKSVQENLDDALSACLVVGREGGLVTGSGEKDHCLVAHYTMADPESRIWTSTSRTWA